MDLPELPYITRRDEFKARVCMTCSNVICTSFSMILTLPDTGQLTCLHFASSRGADD